MCQAGAATWCESSAVDDEVEVNDVGARPSRTMVEITLVCRCSPQRLDGQAPLSEKTIEFSTL